MLCVAHDRPGLKEASRAGRRGRLAVQPGGCAHERPAPGAGCFPVGSSRPHPRPAARQSFRGSWCGGGHRASQGRHSGVTQGRCGVVSPLSVIVPITCLHAHVHTRAHPHANTPTTKHAPLRPPARGRLSFGMYPGGYLIDCSWSHSTRPVPILPFPTHESSKNRRPSSAESKGLPAPSPGKRPADLLPNQSPFTEPLHPPARPGCPWVCIQADT